MTRFAQSFECQGGFRVFTKKRAHAACTHDVIVTVRTAGIQRSVCEKCGKVSFRPLDGPSGEVERSQFERDVERSNTESSSLR